MERGGLISHVLDTCALLDLASGRWTDSEARKELIEASRPVLLAISVWEIARKLRVGKLTLPCAQSGVLHFVQRICDHHQIEIEILDAGLCHAAELLPPVHEDPFDRMIIGLAHQNACPVFTTDERFSSYPVRVIRQH